MRSFLSRAHRPSPAMVVAIVALVAALGGTGYAASSLIESDSAKKQSAEPAPLAAKSKKGRRGPAGPAGPAGPQGAPGQNGAPGQSGVPGTPAPVQYAQFYALMPPDNAATVAPGGTVDFPRVGPELGDIVPVSADAYSLPDPGTYRVAFSVSVTEAGQLGVTVEGNLQPSSVVGRATGTSQISGETLITTLVPDQDISVVNPAGNAAALTITPLAGGAQAVTATLTIEQLSPGVI